MALGNPTFPLHLNECMLLISVGATIGICAVNPDSGDYGAWLNETNHMIAQVSSARSQCKLKDVLHMNS